MLVLSRKPGQEIKLGDEITVSVIKCDRNTVRLGIVAPRNVSILRAEIEHREARPPAAGSNLSDYRQRQAAAKKERILIVDDSPVDREIYRRFLGLDAAHQFDILEADSGEQGLNLIQSEHPSCVLLDYRLPDLDGVEFLEKLEQRPEGHPPVVMLTRFGNEALAVRALKRGAYDYLSKGTLTQEQLCQTISEVLDRSHGFHCNASA